MSGIKKELMIGGALALAATGLVYYLSTTPRAPKDGGDATPDVKGAAAKSMVQPQSTKKERSFIMIKPDGV
jgi:hypothetical protein